MGTCICGASQEHQVQRQGQVPGELPDDHVGAFGLQQSRGSGAAFAARNPLRPPQPELSLATQATRAQMCPDQVREVVEVRRVKGQRQKPLLGRLACGRRATLLRDFEQ